MMPKAFFYRAIGACAILFFLGACQAYALEDGFDFAGKVESGHFDIYYAAGLDLSTLLRQLNVSPSDRLLTGKPAEKQPTRESEFADMIDTLFAQVCNILDMQLYSFKGTIKICRDSAQLNEIYHTLFGKAPGKTTRSFYAYSVNTVYTSAENFLLGVIGHEIAHAVISRYFVVLPSEKIQEVLAAYVEYQLRKAAE